MADIVKQTVGIDVAQDELVVSLGRMSHDTGTEIFASGTFANSPKGFSELLKWTDKLAAVGIGTGYVMEATGVYHEKLAYFLSEHGREVSIVLPNKISNYFRTLEVKTVTDRTASQAICRFGLERKLEPWQRPKRIFRDLKQLTRERDQLVMDRTSLKNQLHAERSEAFPNQGSIKRINMRIQMINSHELEIRTEIAGLVRTDTELSKKIDAITSIPGVGKLTAVIALAETNGFEHIRNKRQLVSYAGLDVRLKESGTSVKGRPRISKKGNRHLRKSMYMPALAAMRFNEVHKALFTRLVSRHGIKMKAAVAVQRKVLELIYIVYKTGKAFERNYQSPTKDGI